MYNGPHIATDGLVLYLDAANIKSYPGSGTTWSDLSGNNNSGTLTNGPTFSTGSLGSIVFDGTDDYLNIPDSTAMQVGDVFTINAWIFPTNLNARYGVFSTRRGNAAGSWQFEVGTANGGANRVAVTGVGTWIFETSNDVISPNIWTNIFFAKKCSETCPERVRACDFRGIDIFKQREKLLSY